MIKRDHDALVRRLEALSAAGLPVEVVGEVEGYPVHRVRLQGRAKNTRPVLLTGGVHGDEPAGVEAVLRFLERDNAALLERFHFLALPCLNPTGYVLDARENSRGQDINRSFDKDEVEEVLLVKKILNDSQFALFVDFHEDWEARGFYLYEGKREGDLFAQKIIEKVSSIGPIDPDDDPEDPALFPGAYEVSASWGERGLTSYVLYHHAPRTLIFETPTAWDLDHRARTHLQALDTTLSLL